MPFIHNMNKHERKYFCIMTDTTQSGSERVSVEIQRDKFRFYQPGIKSLQRIQSLLDSNQFRVKVTIEIDRRARNIKRVNPKFYDFIMIEIV